MKHKILWLGLSWLIVAAFVLASCGPAAPPGEQEEEEAEKVLTVAVEDLGTEVWWPQTAGYESIVNQSVGDSLTRVLSPWVVEPAIASSWTVSTNGLRWDFTLRDDAYFTDGTKVTAEDAKFILDLRQELSGWSGLKKNITTVEAQGNHLIINLSNPIPQILDNYLGWLPIRPKHYIDEVGWEGYNKIPIGCGPFKFVEYKRGEYAILERNDEYYGHKPSIDKVILRIVHEPATRIAMLRTGEADATFNELGPNTVELVKYGFRVKAAGPPAQDYVLFNRLSRPTRVESVFDDVRVRQALLYALDRDALAGGIYHGTAVGGGNVFGVTKALGPASYNEAYPAHPYDPDKARQLLTEAGYPNGFTTAIRTYPAKTDLALSMMSYWNAVGVKAELILDDTRASTIDNWYKHTSEDDFCFLDCTVGIGMVDLFIVGSGADSCGYSSPETDIRDVGEAVIGAENQAKWLHDVYTPIMYEAMGILPLTETTLYVIGLGPRIKSWTDVDYRTLGFEYVELYD